jgi:hypothetical protein
MAKGKCAFCDRHGNLTSEHAWPKWLHNILFLELRNLHHCHLTVRPNRHSGSKFLINREQRSGDPGSRKLPIVCANCNNGWMSILQEHSKPYLTPIIQGQWINLSECREVFAKWCVMTTMVNEYQDPPTISIPQLERDRLRLGLPLSDNWLVWVGQCPLESPNRRAAHRAYTIFDGQNNPGKPNCQVTTLHVGKMLIQVIFAPFNKSHLDVLYTLQSGMKPVHPRPAPSLSAQPNLLRDHLIEPHQARLVEFFEIHLCGLRTYMPVLGTGGRTW